MATPPYVEEVEQSSQEAPTSATQATLVLAPVDVALAAGDSAKRRLAEVTATAADSAANDDNANDNDTLPPLAPPKRPYRSVGWVNPCSFPG